MSTSTKYVDLNAELIDRCRQGDERAQFELYDRYYGAMYNTALRMLSDPMEAEDVMQDAFLEAFRKLHTFRGDSAFGAWLKRIVVNRCLNVLKRRKVDLSMEQAGDLPAETLSVADAAQWSVEEIKRAVADLADGYRVILTLYLFEGFDHEEIAEVLHISSATSRSQFARAKGRLRQQLIKVKSHAG